MRSASASQESKPFGVSDAKLQSLETRIEALQVQAAMFASLPIFPQRVRGFFSALVETLAAMHAAIDAMQAERAGEGGQ